MSLKKYVFFFWSELLCTMNLVAFMCLACSRFEEKLWALSFAHGALVLILILLFKPISGAHGNPAISLALFLRRRMSLKRLLLYVVAQMSGGILGHYVANILLGKLPSDTLCTFGPMTELSNIKLMAIEFLLTLLMITMWCILWDYKGKLPTACYLAIVSVVVCLLGGHVTGAATNPARALAPVLFTEKSSSTFYLVMGQILAGVAAPMLWNFLDK